jgi:hypothetical protein
MRFIRLQNLTLALSLVAICAFVAITAVPVAHAQTNTTGAVVGVVSDSTGAFIPGAKVIVTNQATGAAYTVTTSSVGDYRVSQLAPGAYSITVEAKGFERSKQVFDVSAGTVGSANVSLTVGNASVTVEVNSGEVALLHVDDAQLSTAFTEEQIQTLPNPGNDLTFIAQTAPGSVMNTQSEYGNFSSYGLPGTANSFTINGGYDNDPFLNISNSGASNLALGANDISVETVISNAYNASFGGLGGSQVSEISRSGGNQFHGNVNYQWNGRLLNANDFFNKLSGSPRAFDNANQYAGAIGGPIKRNKAFFFVNYEGLRVILPSRATVYAPDASYQTQVLANLVANGLGSETAVYQNIFNLYKNAPGYSTGTVPTGGGDEANDGYGFTSFNATASNFTHEYLVNPRIDWNISDKDHLFGHATIDKGVQATYTNVLNPLYDALSAQPSYQGQLGETHTFSPTLSNQFLFSMIYYVAVFSNANEAASEDPSKGGMPFSLIFADTLLGNNPGAAYPGGENFVWPQGRNVTGYQFQDDVSWTKGKHTLSVGWTVRRDDVTDYSPSEFTTSPEAYTTSSSFQQGYVDYWQEQFPTRSTQPVALYDMGWYAQDQWKVMPNLTLTYGLRMEHNSNPICVTDCFAHLAGNFANAPTSNSTAYNQIINSSLHQAMTNLQVLGWEPRIGFAYLPFGSGSKTTVRGGFGMFADAFPGVIADDMLNNAPTNVPFTIYGPAFGGGNNTLVPTAAGSAQSIAAQSAAGFQAGFSTGGSYNTISTAVPTFSAPSMVNPAAILKYPTYEEWNLAIEQQISRFDSLSISYVGNRSYHEPELNVGINVYNGGGAAGFPELSASAAPNPNFGAVNQISSSSNGNFNGLVVSAQHRSKSLTVTFNYMWSHALDEISNGGFEPFTGSSIYPDDPFDLRKNYGNADYDTRQYVSGSYVYALPHFWGPRVLVDNWEASGTVFHSTGLPFSVTDSTTASELTNYGSSEPLYARKVGNFSGTHCNGKAAATGTPCSFVSNFTGTATFADGAQQTANYATDFGQSRRNQLFGPNYTDADLTVTKGFIIPGWQSAKVKVGASFFNLFNHQNFAQPQAAMSYCSASAIGQGSCTDLYQQTNSSLGTILSAVNPPTSILGSFLGGDASPRLIQAVLKFQF